MGLVNKKYEPCSFSIMVFKPEFTSESSGDLWKVKLQISEFQAIEKKKFSDDSNFHLDSLLKWIQYQNFMTLSELSNLEVNQKH